MKLANQNFFLFLNSVFESRTEFLFCALLSCLTAAVLLSLSAELVIKGLMVRCSHANFVTDTLCGVNISTGVCFTTANTGEKNEKTK